MVIDLFPSRRHRFCSVGTAVAVTFEHEQSVRPWKVLLLPAAATVVVGILAGLLWAVVVPVERFAVVQPGLGAALTGESLHRFDSIALFVCIALVTGVVVPVAFWAWTRARGPVLYLGLFLGAAVGSAVMVGVGVGVTGLLHARPDDPAVGSLVDVAPGMQSPLVLLVQPLVTSLVVLLLTAMNPHDNLRFTSGLDESSEGPNREERPLESDRA